MNNTELCKTVQKLESIEKGSFGGYYLSEDQESIIINITEPMNNKAELLSIKSAISKPVVRSLQTLEDIQSFLDSYFDKYSINRTSIDIINNKVFVGIDEDSDTLKKEIEALIMREKAFGEDAIVIRQMDRVQNLEMDFSDEPLDWSSAVEVTANDTVKCMPGGLIGRGSSPSNITAVASVSGGVYYNGSPFFMTAGHGATTGEKMYYIPLKSSDTTYPTDYSALKSYNPNNRIYLGTSTLVKYGGYYDFTSIKRASTCTLNMQGTAYNGIKPTVFGRSPLVNERCWYTGVANKRTYSSSNYVTCTDIKTTYVDERDKQMKDVIVINHRGTTGTSGGPLFNRTSVPNSAWNFAGTASSRGTNETFFVKFSHAMNDYSLTPVFP